MNEAQEVRKELKALGYNNRKVGVKTSSGGGLDISIHDHTISKDEIEKIARKYESISRCHASGEILCGGNTFVFINYSSKAAEKFIAENKEAIEAIQKKAGEVENHTGEEVAGYTVMKTDFQYRIFLAGDTHTYAWFSKDCNYSLAYAMIKLSFIEAGV